MSRVNIDDRAWGDRRFRKLARLLNWGDEFAAIGRMAYLWHLCTDMETDILTSRRVGAVFDCSDGIAVGALVESELGEEVAGGVRIRGCEGRTDWLAAKRANGKKGGEASAKRRASESKRKPSKGQANPTLLAPCSLLKEHTRALPSGQAFDFEAAYQPYPRKRGKSSGMAKLRKIVTTPEDFARLRDCIATMGRAWSSADKQYCPYFSTFVSGKLWRDEEWPLPKGHAQGSSDPRLSAEVRRLYE